MYRHMPLLLTAVPYRSRDVHGFPRGRDPDMEGGGTAARLHVTTAGMRVLND